MNKVTIVHQSGIPVGATVNGRRIERPDALFVAIPGIQRLIPTAPYDNHFVYQSDVVGESTYQCTCGAPAVVIRTNQSSGQYGASLTDPHAKLLLVCLLHASTGRHTNAS